MGCRNWEGTIALRSPNFHWRMTGPSRRRSSGVFSFFSLPVDCFSSHCFLGSVPIDWMSDLLIWDIYIITCGTSSRGRAYLSYRAGWIAYGNWGGRHFCYRLEWYWNLLKKSLLSLFFFFLVCRNHQPPYPFDRARSAATWYPYPRYPTRIWIQPRFVPQLLFQMVGWVVIAVMTGSVGSFVLLFDFYCTLCPLLMGIPFLAAWIFTIIAGGRLRIIRSLGRSIR